jgi:hypothetical protein
MIDGRGKMEDRRQRTEDRGKIKCGQSTLELTVALIIFAMLFVAAVKIFVWLNAGLVNRQVEYDDTRVGAGRGGNEQRIKNITNLDNVTSQDLVIVDESGKREKQYNEPLIADLNLTSEF